MLKILKTGNNIKNKIEKLKMKEIKNIVEKTKVK